MTVIRAKGRLLSHAVAVLALTAFYAVLWVVHVEAPDAGPLSGLALWPALVPLILLGLPWSIFPLLGASGTDDHEFMVHFLMLGPAWANVAVHALLAWPKRRATNR